MLIQRSFSQYPTPCTNEAARTDWVSKKGIRGKQPTHPIPSPLCFVVDHLYLQTSSTSTDHSRQDFAIPISLSINRPCCPFTLDERRALALDERWAQALQWRPLDGRGLGVSVLFLSIKYQSAEDEPWAMRMSAGRLRRWTKWSRRSSLGRNNRLKSRMLRD